MIETKNRWHRRGQGAVVPGGRETYHLEHVALALLILLQNIHDLLLAADVLCAELGALRGGDLRHDIAEDPVGLDEGVRRLVDDGIAVLCGRREC